MVTPIDIALSGLAAQTRRVEASASNVANQRTRGALPEQAGAVPAGQPAAYRPVAVAQTAGAQPSAANGSGAGGTRAVFTPITPAFHPEYEPDAPYADAGGLVAAPNVDPAGEAVNQITASRLYAANAAVVRTADDMLKSLLDDTV